MFTLYYTFIMYSCFMSIHEFVYISLTLQVYNPDFRLQLKQTPTGMFPVSVLKQFGNFPRKDLK